MPSTSRLNNLLVRNFRAFRHLCVEGLSDVNLVVGGNNLGKSSLLEALHLYFLQGSRTRIPELLLAREEFSFKRMRTRTTFRNQDVALAYESLFFGRPSLETSPSLSIGPLDETSASLQITFTLAAGIK